MVDVRQHQSLEDCEMELIDSYTRTEAMEDGVLIDVTDTAKEAGIKYPTAVTRSVWEEYVKVPNGLLSCQDEDGRLWDILWMLRWGINQRKKDSESLLFTLHVVQSRDARTAVELKAVCGPGDHAEPVLTIMLPNED